MKTGMLAVVRDVTLLRIALVIRLVVTQDLRYPLHNGC
jgi:hypothetical protein